MYLSHNFKSVMDFFGGDFKSKRNINLGGKKVLKKDELLQRTQLERQKRELERQRNRCALKIQSWYRSRRCAIVVKSACRAEWDALWNALASETSVSSEVIQKLVSLFLFFFVPTYDRRRLQGLVRYLTLPASDIGSLNLAIPVMTPLLELQHNWYRNLGRLIECLRRTIITSKMNADLLHESIEFLWQITHNPVFNIRGLFGTGLLEFVIRNGVYDILRQLVDFENLDSQTAVRVVSISFWPLLQYRDNSEYLQPSLKYFVTFLFVPSLLSKLSSQAAKFTEDFPVELIASYLLQNPLYIRELRASNADNNTVHLLSNFISILKEKMLAGEVDQTSVVQLLLLLLQDMKEANSDFFEESSEELSISPMGEMIASSPIFTTVTNGRVKNDMDFLYDKSFIAFLSRILMSEHSELDKGPVCSLLCLLLHLRPSKKKEIVRYILYNSKKSVLLALYECVRSSIFYSNISSTLNQFEEFSQLHMSPLFLLSEVLVDHLNLLGDDEFFNENKFLPLHAVLDISALFRDVCFTLFWEGVADVYLKSVGQHLHWYRSMFSRILMEIYLRDSRRNFCPENFWIKLQDVDVDAFADIFSFDDEEMSEMEHRGLNSQQVKNYCSCTYPLSLLSSLV
ncbi:hypothetical protein BC829DRAFT_192103 [Chytridium lagenaria]|nr:hypothetical protein BC829DRAFT_192103 [Chytridium lagenaria]